MLLKRVKWLASSRLLSAGLWIHQALLGLMGMSARFTAIPIATGKDQIFEVRSNRSGLAGQLDLELLFKLAVVVHLDQDVGSTHKFPLDIHLRDCGPL